MIVGIDGWNTRRGGGVTYLRELLEAARPADYGIQKIIIWSRSSVLNLLPEREWLKKIQVHALEAGPIKSFVWHFSRIDHELARHHCDVLLTPGMVHLGRFRPYVAVCQNLLPFSPRERARFGFGRQRMKFHLLEYIQTWTFRRAAGVVFLTNSAKEVVERKMGFRCGNSTVIPHGIAQRFVRPPSDDSISPPPVVAPRPFRWLYVSIIDYYKHQENVASAAAELIRSGFDIAIDFVGPANGQLGLKFEATLRRLDPTGERLRYSGAVDFTRLHRKYHEADAFVFASSCENLPNILIEAMAARLPIACSNFLPMPEVLRDGGVYFNPERPSEIEAAMRRLQADVELRNQLANRAYILARAYSWEQCAAQTLTYLAEVARRFRSHQPVSLTSNVA